MSTLTLDEIAALEALHAKAPGAGATWTATRYDDEFGGRSHHVYSGKGEMHNGDVQLAVADADTAEFVAAALNALPALLSLARRGLEAEEGPNEHEVCALAAAECDALADEYEAAGDSAAADACRECGDRIEEMDVRELFRAADAGEAP